VAPGECAACGHGDLVDVFRVTASRTTTTKAGVSHTWHDPACPACGSKFRQLLLGARNATLGAVTIEQTWASPFNDDKKLIAFSDSVQDAAHRAGFFTARTYLNTVRTGLAQVIDQIATPQCSWNTFLDKSANLWHEKDSPLAMPVERFVSEFIGPNMMWQRDWAVSMQAHDHLPKDSHSAGAGQEASALAGLCRIHLPQSAWTQSGRDWQGHAGAPPGRYRAGSRCAVTRSAGILWHSPCRPADRRAVAVGLCLPLATAWRGGHAGVDGLCA
jgi:hypothetical protein